MRVVGMLLKVLLVLVLAALVGVTGWLYAAPPDLIRIATGYTAKIVCSNMYVAGRDGLEVLTVDVQAPGHPILEYIVFEEDADARRITSRLFGLFVDSTAAYRDGTGCASVPDGNTDAARLPAVASGGAGDLDAIWPEGEGVEQSLDPVIAAILDDEVMTGPGMRAVVVVHRGRIVGERYGPGFTEETPLLGWSMTKTVTAAIVGTLVGEGRLSLDQDGLFEIWSEDGRSAITIADLMAMSSGLAFNEDYGDVTDVTRMLYLEPDMAGFAADKPLEAEIGTRFSYSSGTSVLLSSVWQSSFADRAEALSWPRQALFDPLGMTSAIMEADARGTFVGSSYLYATARDWARFGQFLLQDGEWDGRRILPEGFVSWMREPAPASGGTYGRGQLWLHGPTAGSAPGTHPDDGFSLPDDAFWLLGHDGQSMAVVPSRELVVLRLGLTPPALGYKPQAMVEALAAALE